jgi:lysophospholipase L1-like esterase
MNRLTIALLGTALALLLAVEALTIRAFDRTSKVQRREIAQRRALLAVNDTNTTRPSHIAVLGNSLLLDGLNVQILTEQTEAEAIPVPYFVLATDYYDWYFGLKRLFAEGMRPRYVLLGLSPNQLASSRTRGEYSAHYLFRGQDLIEVVQKTHMDATTASSFLLAHISKFYSTRQITRNYILGRLLPDVAGLLHEKLGAFRDPAIPEATLTALATNRLKSLDELCRANGAQFMLVVPPTYQSGSETIAHAGKELGIAVLMPVSKGELDESFFQSDGIHLNEKGAIIFTNRLADGLRTAL